MQKFIKNLRFIAMLGVSAVNVSVSLWASAANPLSNPDNMPIISAKVTGPAALSAQKAIFSDWLSKTDEGKAFLQEVGLPANLGQYNLSNPREVYRAWHTQKFGGQIPETQRQEIASKAREEGRTAAAAEVSAEMTALRANAGGALMASLSPQAARIMQAVHAAKDAAIEGIEFAAHDAVITASPDDRGTITINAIIGGQAAQAVYSSTRAEYERLVLLQEIAKKMYSRAYEAAAGAMGGVFHEILSSAAPLPHHDLQISALASSSGRLKEHLDYHREWRQKLADWNAMPLSGFLKINFLDGARVTAMRGQAIHEFESICAGIPSARDGTGIVTHYGSPALTRFIQKVRISLNLPSKAVFSVTEISDILAELGLKFDVDADGHVATGSAYFDWLVKISKDYSDLKSMARKKNQDVFDEHKDLLETQANQAIALNNLDGFIAILDQLASFYPGQDGIGISIAVRNIKVAIDGRMGAGGLRQVPLTPATFPALEAGTASVDIRAGHPEVLRAVLFLIKQFVPRDEQNKAIYDKVLDKSLAGNLDPAVLAALISYYKVEPPLGADEHAHAAAKGAANELIAALRKPDAHLSFNGENYKQLRASESAIYVSAYLKELMKGTEPVEANLNDLKLRIGIDTRRQAKVRNQLVLRTCEFMNSDAPATQISEGNVNSIAAEHFGDPRVGDAITMFGLLANGLKTEAERARFFEDYMRAPIDGVDIGDKVRNADRFFQEVLLSSAKNAPFTKLAKKFPALKAKYQKGHQDLLGKVDQFLRTFDARNLTGFIGIDGVAYTDPDEARFVDGILRKIAMLQSVVKEFLEGGDNADAMIRTGGGASAPDTSSSSAFSIVAGVRYLSFDEIFAGSYNRLYGAAKTLHFVELTMPSDADMERLAQIISSAVNPSAKDAVKAKVGIVSGCVKALRERAASSFAELKDVVSFVGEFKEIKTKCDAGTGGESFDLYASVDALAAVATSSHGGPPPMMGGPGPLGGPSAPGAIKDFSAGAVPAAITGIKDFGSKGDVKMNNEASAAAGLGPKFNKATTSEDNLRLLAVRKFGDSYTPLLAAQMAYFGNIDMRKIGEGDIVPFMKQLMVFMDLYMRSKLLASIVSAHEKTESRLAKLFIANYADVFTSYDARSIFSYFKGNPTEASYEPLTRLLRNSNLALRTNIARALINLFATADMDTTVNISALVTGIIDAEIAANPFVASGDGGRLALNDAALQAFINVSPKKS